MGRFLFLNIALVLASACVSAQKQAIPDSILGEWFGESKCVGTNTFCHDEVVVYTLTRSKQEASKVHWSADKIVDGKRDFMGDLDMVYDDKKSTISGDFKIPRTGGTGVWLFTIKGDKMEGTLTTYPENEVGRRISVARKK